MVDACNSDRFLHGNLYHYSRHLLNNKDALTVFASEENRRLAEEISVLKKKMQSGKPTSQGT